MGVCRDKTRASAFLPLASLSNGAPNLTDLSACASVGIKQRSERIPLPSSSLIRTKPQTQRFYCACVRCDNTKERAPISNRALISSPLVAHQTDLPAWDVFVCEGVHAERKKGAISLTPQLTSCSFCFLIPQRIPVIFPRGSLCR